MMNFQGNQETDLVANLGAVKQEPHEPSEDWLHWELVVEAVRHFWVILGPKLRVVPETLGVLASPQKNKQRVDSAEEVEPPTS
eukprot:5677005-Amphidinium_carterae.1